MIRKLFSDVLGRVFIMRVIVGGLLGGVVSVVPIGIIAFLVSDYVVKANVESLNAAIDRQLQISQATQDEVKDVEARLTTAITNSVRDSRDQLQMQIDTTRTQLREDIAETKSLTTSTRSELLQLVAGTEEKLYDLILDTRELVRETRNELLQLVRETRDELLASGEQ